MFAHFLIRHASFSAADCLRNHFWFMLHFPEAVIGNKSTITFSTNKALLFTSFIVSETGFYDLFIRFAKKAGGFHVYHQARENSTCILICRRLNTIGGRRFDRGSTPPVGICISYRLSKSIYLSNASAQTRRGSAGAEERYRR